jgi:DNA-binding response OmpR family regulator
VLVVDDDPVIRNLLEVNLQLEGYEVALAEDGADALSQIAATPPDLVLLDVMMPNVDGWEVAEQLKGDAATAHIPVAFLTARAMRSDVTRGTDLGVEAYVTKPFDPEELLALVARLLREAAGELP